MGYTIVAITNEWDIFMRRYRSLFSELVNFKYINYILCIEPPLTFYSFMRFIIGKIDRRDNERWKRVLKKGFISREKNIFIITPIVPFPFLSVRLLLEFNTFWLIKLQLYFINSLKRNFEFGDVILWINHPYFSSGLVSKISRKLFCYDLCDDYYTKEKNKMSIFAQLLKENDDYLTETADIMFVSSKKLFEDRSSKRSNIHRVPNGVHLDFIRRNFCKNTEPVDLRYVPRPRLIYIGNISSAIDLELLKFINKAHPKWSLVMIGPLHGKTIKNNLKKISSVYLLDAKPYEESIEFLKHSDVPIIPYLKCLWTISCDSLKIYNFLASGKPVVTTKIGGVENFRETLLIANDHEDFLTKIEYALHQTQEESERRKKIQYEMLEEHTWQKRAEIVYNLMMAQLQSGKEGFYEGIIN